MKNYLLDLSSRPGFEGLADLAKALERIAKKKAEYGGEVILPNLYLSTMDGYDIEEIVTSLEETLSEGNLLRFPNSLKHYCLSLDYSYPQDAGFPAFQSLIYAVEEELSRFGVPFQGILVVDITDWVAKGATTERKFLDFLRYMADLDERTLAIYIERTGNDSQSENARKSLVTKTRLEKYELKLKSPQIALQILENDLSSFGFKIDEPCKNKILETLAELVKVKGQEGPWTIRQLAEDMVYSAFKADGELDRVLKDDVLASFYPGGTWIGDFTAKKRYYMGLIGD